MFCVESCQVKLHLTCIGWFSLNPMPARADMFGGDILVLTQILTNSIQQLTQLISIVKTTKDNLNFLKDINRGINDSLQLLQTIERQADPTLYADWKRPAEALKNLVQEYGAVPRSKDERIQRDIDQNVSEAISLGNSIYKFSNDADRIGEDIKKSSHLVSPSGAQKLTAQSVGVMIGTMNESLRAQATGLKLQAQSMATENHREKETTRQILETTENLKNAMKQQDTHFTLPKF